MAEDPVLAKPPGECCLKGAVQLGEPHSNLVTIAGVETYVARPAEGKSNGNIVLYFPDIFALYENGRQVIDAFATAGYTALGLDYFKGDDVSKHMDEKHAFLPGFDFESWKDKNVAVANDVVPKWIVEVKTQYGKADTKYACVGYCFGAPYSMNELADDLVCAGAFAHPAFLNESHFANIKKPLFLSCAESDVAFTTEPRRKAIDVLIKEKKQYHLQLFPGVEHGFALKGDVTKPYEKYAKEESLRGIIAWFDFWLSQ